MNDAQLHALRQDPSPEFAERLLARLQRDERPVARRPAAWLRAAAGPALAAVGMAVLLTLPAVRASAQSFLALFRVTNFVAVEVDSNRLAALKARHLDLKTLLDENAQEVRKPGPALPVVSLEQAAQAAGFDLKVPSWMPAGSRIIEMSVTGEGIARVTANGTRLRQVMDFLGITDLDVPAGVDGQVLTVRVPPAVMVRYEHGGRRTRFFQGPAPEVTMPAGFDLPALGEIGLRILGLSREDARQMARAIDWRSTLVVPLPSGIHSLKRVDIGGNPGIAVEYTDASRTSMVLWSDGGRVFGLVSLQEMSDVLEMANSVR
jgi:hypothetical protein